MDPEELRVCETCEIPKPLSDYTERVIGSGKWNKSCTKCLQARAREIDDHRYANYGLRKSDFDRLVILQHGRCKICKIKFSTKRIEIPVVDHSHSAGHVRGIICAGCNLAEGFIKTSAKAFALAKYMQQNELFEAPAITQ